MTWRERAACRGKTTERWFPETIFGDADRTNVPSDVAAICGACPVTAECLDYATRTGIDDGVGGGLAPKDRARRGLECGMCGTWMPMPDGRVRRYCSKACADEAHRKNRRAHMERKRMAS